MTKHTRSPHSNMTDKKRNETTFQVNLNGPATSQQYHHLAELGVTGVGVDLTEADAAALINQAYNAKRLREARL